MTNTEGSASEPQTVDEARDAVERSRERISRTLDRLEDRIVEKKHELQERANVFRPIKDQVRRRPLTALAVAVGVGALVGSLGGGRHDKRGRHNRPQSRLSDDDRAELRAWRKQRRHRLRALRHDSADNGRHQQRHSSARRDSIKGQLIGAATTAITAAVTSRVREFMRGSADQHATAPAMDTHA